MTEKKKSIRCGRAKEKQVGKGTLIKLTLNLDTLSTEFGEHGFTGDHGRMISVDLWPTPDSPYGNSHDVVVDTWKPDPNYQRSPAPTPAPAPAPAPRPAATPAGDNPVDDIPF